jgi:hypothetical protein
LVDVLSEFTRSKPGTVEGQERMERSFFKSGQIITQVVFTSPDKPRDLEFREIRI